MLVRYTLNTSGQVLRWQRATPDLQILAGVVFSIGEDDGT